MGQSCVGLDWWEQGSQKGVCPEKPETSEGVKGLMGDFEGDRATAGRLRLVLLTSTGHDRKGSSDAPRGAGSFRTDLRVFWMALCVSP